MANINAYDYANTGVNIAKMVIGSTVDVKSKTKDLARDYYKIDTERDLKKAELQNRKDVQQMINDNNLALKSMGIENDRLLAVINNLSARDRVQLQNESAQLIQLLKNKNVLDAIEEQYKANVNELNLSSDEAMKRAVLGGLFNILSTGKTPLGDLVKTGEATLLLQLMKEMFPGIETWNDSNFTGLGGKSNENRITAETKRETSYEEAIKERQKALERSENLNKTNRGRSKGLERR